MKNKIILIILTILMLAFVGTSIAIRAKLKSNDVNTFSETNNNINEEKNVANNIVAENNAKNVIIDNEIEETVTNTEVPAATTEEIGKEELEKFTNNEDKAIQIVKNHWGEDSVNRFSAYQNSDGTYTVEIIKPDTTVWCRYIVNVETGKYEISE